MSRTALIWLCAAAALVPAAGATDYWAFGDSVTRGSADPVNWMVVFDAEDPPPTTCPRATCGYNWRLEGLLGVGDDVINRGMAAETTVGGLLRIDDPGEPLATSRCTDANAGDVLLLMEGTNNVSNGFTTTDIRDDLAAMLDLATTKCVHSAIASVIRRLLSGTATGSHTGDPGHPATADLAVKISALASAKSRAYVDVWASLCPNQTCYNSNYWGRLGPQDPGHIDASGYDIMAPLFAAPITAQPAAGAATLTGPSGEVDDATPDFTWDEHPNADWYFLEVEPGSTYGRWHPEEEICTGGTCSFDPGVALADDDYSWRVRTRNLRGVGSWSATTNFTVCLSRDLPDPGSVTSAVTETACKNLRALLGYSVASGGVVSFEAGDTIELGNGFEVLTGGEFTASNN